MEDLNLNKKLIFALTTFIIGFMVSVQMNSVHEPNIRDTRDTWQLREDLQKEKELEAKLIREIMSIEKKLSEYETARKQSKELTLRETLDELKKEAGLTEVTGPGIIINIEEMYQLSGQSPANISPDLLQRLLNELKRYGAKEISVGGQRIIQTTVIREIANETKINGRSLNRFPIEIRVITENFQTARELFNRMEVSKAKEVFFIDNLQVKVKEPEENITVPAYTDPIRVRGIESVKPDKGGSS